MAERILSHRSCIPPIVSSTQCNNSNEPIFIDATDCAEEYGFAQRKLGAVCGIAWGFVFGVIACEVIVPLFLRAIGAWHQ